MTIAVLMLLMGASAGVSARSSDSLIEQKSYWLDVSGQADLAEVMRHSAEGRFETFSDLLSLGFQPNPVWIRLDVPAGDPTAEPWVLRLRPSWHDRIELFDPVAYPHAAQLAGDQFPISAEAYRSLNLNFLLARRDAPRSVFLKIDTVHSVMFSAELLPRAVATRLDQRQALFFLLYLFFLGFVLFTCLPVFFSDPEWVLGSFCLQLSLALLYVSSMYGGLRWALDGLIANQSLDQLNNLLIILYPATTIWFYRMFYADYGLHPWAARSLDLALLLAGVNVLLVLAGFAQAGLRSNALVLSLVAAPLILSPWFFFDRQQAASPDKLPLWLVRLVTTLMLSFALIGVTRTLGVFTGSESALNGFMVHAFLLALLMSGALRHRAMQRHRALVIERAKERQQAETEALARQSLERFMHMFSHEIKTPLSAVSLAVERGIPDPALASQAERAIREIDQLVSRCLQVDQVEARAVTIRPEDLNLSALVHQCASRLGCADRLHCCSDVVGYAQGDRWMTETIIANLLENAVKYGVDQQPIVIEIRLADEHSITLQVSNASRDSDGCDLGRIFDKFYRSPQATRKSGAGLGLYLARALAEQQGGSLQACRREPDRLCFELRMPR